MIPHGIINTHLTYLKKKITSGTLHHLPLPKAILFVIKPLLFYFFPTNKSKSEERYPKIRLKRFCNCKNSNFTKHRIIFLLEKLIDNGKDIVTMKSHPLHLWKDFCALLSWQRKKEKRKFVHYVTKEFFAHKMKSPPFESSNQICEESDTKFANLG